jgi:AraC-like DNA-binding protein
MDPDRDIERLRDCPVPLEGRMLADGRDWTVSEYICRAGPEDRPFEERHEHFSIAAVVSGSFTYRSDTGTTLLHPGGFLLGNHGACFECGHEHGRGDRCIALHVAPDYFAEIAATTGGTMKFKFPAAMLPAMPQFLPLLAAIEAGGEVCDPLRIEVEVPQLIEAVIGAMSGLAQAPARVSARDVQRISRALRHIENHAGEAIDLAELAAVAAASKYHFLRTFRRVVGMTPYQFLLGIRMRRAAVRLATTSEPVSTIAFEAGFGDLSTFNHRFRSVFGSAPQTFRARRTAA